MSQKIKLNIMCGLLQASYCILACFGFSFFTAFLTSEGYSKSQAGQIIALLALSLMIFQPMYGILADKKFNIKWIVICVVAVASTALSLVPFVSHNIFLLVPLCIIIGGTGYGFGGMIDCWCMRIGGEEGLVNYGIVRGMGSFGFAVVAMSAGGVFDTIGMQYTFYCCLAMGVITIIIALFLPGSLPPNIASVTEDSAQMKVTLINFVRYKECRVQALEGVKVLTSNRRYTVFLISGTLVYMGAAAVTSFMITLLESVGGSSEHLGYAIAVQAFCEIPVMFCSAMILSKFNIKFLLSLSFIGYVFKFLLPVFATNPTQIIVIATLQALTFGLFMPCMVKHITLISPEGYKNTGLTFAIAVCNGFGHVVGNITGGIIADTLGIKAVYTFAGILAIISTCVFILFDRAE